MRFFKRRSILKNKYSYAIHAIAFLLNLYGDRGKIYVRVSNKHDSNRPSPHKRVSENHN